VLTPARRLAQRAAAAHRSLLVEPVSTVDAPYHRSAAFFVRVGGLAAVAAALLAVLALRLWSLQVIQGPAYARLATQQSFRWVDLPAARAAIVDAKGRLLAGTNGRVVVTADRTSLGTLDANGRWHANAEGLEQLQRLSRLASVPLATLVERVERAVARSPYAPAIVISRPPATLAAFLEERAASYPGLRIETLPVRSYPQGGLGSEFLGLLGEIQPQQLDTPRYGDARAGQVVGQSGVEAAYDRMLNGGFRKAHVRVDSRGRIMGQLRVRGATALPPTLHLTINARIQRAAERAIRDGIALARRNGHRDASAGAAVVIDPRNGGLYALASYPDYNQLLAAHDPAYLSGLLRAENAPPLLDRATQGLFPTGSTFKPIVAEAALATGLITPWTSLACTGSFTVGNFVFHNFEAGINEPMNVSQALAASCDTWFYRLGESFYFRQQNTGALDIQRWAMRLGLGRPTGIDVPGESAGVVPTPAWVKRVHKQPWYEGFSINLAIGQGYLAVTPLQLAVAYSALANGGTVVRPHVASAIGDRKLRFAPRRRVHLKDMQTIRDALYEAAHGPSGTSTSVFGSFPVPVAGKTGTAEAPPGSDHSWYASWAPAGHPSVVVVVLIEHGGFGAEAAAPAAREIYEAFFRLKPKQHG
jgi:penicillin-binding protein 2